MLTNPFTPIFGGKPDSFFGRKDILNRFEIALLDRGSEDRALFITGVRGNGKTALVEQLSRRANMHGWHTIDLGSDNLLETLLRNLVRQSEQTQTLSPSASVNILGTGVGISAGSISKTLRYTTADLQNVFVDFCKEHKEGVFVSIDEVQKVPLEALSTVCEVFQIASRKGHDVILVLAGLPYSYEQVIHHEGCTFMRRGVHERIGLFSREEAYEAFKEAFSCVDGLLINDFELRLLVEASYGHPYLIQLIGYYLVFHVNALSQETPYTITRGDIQVVLPRAIAAYERRALRPMIEELNESERAYLGAMARRIDSERMVSTGDIADELGKNQNELSPTRKNLIKKGIAIVPKRGYLMFNVPYLAGYMQNEATSDKEVELAREWRL